MATSCMWSPLLVTSVTLIAIVPSAHVQLLVITSIDLLHASSTSVTMCSAWNVSGVLVGMCYTLRSNAREIRVRVRQGAAVDVESL